MAYVRYTNVNDQSATADEILLPKERWRDTGLFDQEGNKIFLTEAAVFPFGFIGRQKRDKDGKGT